jgi:hypothetical protein
VVALLLLLLVALLAVATEMKAADFISCRQQILLSSKRTQNQG